MAWLLVPWAALSPSENCWSIGISIHSFTQEFIGNSHKKKKYPVSVWVLWAKMPSWRQGSAKNGKTGLNMHKTSNLNVGYQGKRPQLGVPNKVAKECTEVTYGCQTLSRSDCCIWRGSRLASWKASFLQSLGTRNKCLLKKHPNISTNGSPPDVTETLESETGHLTLELGSILFLYDVNIISW